MAFVEAMVIEVSRGDAPERPHRSRCRSRASPTPRRWTASARDKPDLRFGMELVDLGAVLALDGRRPGFRVFDETLAAGGRVKAIVAPGLAGASRARDRRADRARASGSARRASSTSPVEDRRRSSRRSRSSSATTVAAARRARRREPGRPRPDRRRRARRHAPTCSAGCGWSSASGLGLADPNVLVLLLDQPLPDVPVGRRERALGRDPQPVLGRAAGGRAAARRPRPATRTEPSPDDPAGQARAMQYDIVLNGWELGGGSVRIHRRDLLERSLALQGHSRGRCTRSSARCSTRSSTARRRTAASRSASTAGRRCSPSRRTSARSWRSRRPSPAAT